MNGLVKALTCILGVLAAVACLATIGIIGYTLSDKSSEKNIEPARQQEVIVLEEESPAPATTSEEAEATASISPGSTGDLAEHVHDYKASEEIKATCYQAGRIKYTCECGDSYYVDVMSTGHVADDWEIIRKPTAQQDGLRVKKCIYCDEILAQENVEYEGTGTDASGGGSAAEQEHVHQYTAETVREPSCTLAGLRKYSCSCGNFYTEMIPAPGHVASDWTVAAEATSKQMGTEQRTCTVCGVLLDSRPIAALSPSPSAAPSASAAATATTATGTASPAATTTPTASPSPSPTPHAHNYTSYVLKEANCTEKGIRSFICDCGSSYAESIELNLNNHTYRAVAIPATQTTQGYTIYTCIRCNYSYYDNYTPALGNQ